MGASSGNRVPLAFSTIEEKAVANVGLTLAELLISLSFRFFIKSSMLV